MMRKNKTTLAMAALLSGAMILAFGGASEAAGKTGSHTHSETDAEATRIVYGTVDDVARNLVKVNQEKTEGISPRYLDLSEVERKGSIQKGDQVKMKVNQHNMVIDYWIMEEQ